MEGNLNLPTVIFMIVKFWTFDANHNLVQMIIIKKLFTSFYFILLFLVNDVNVTQEHLHL